MYQSSSPLLKPIINWRRFHVNFLLIHTWVTVNIQQSKTLFILTLGGVSSKWHLFTYDEKVITLYESMWD